MKRKLLLAVTAMVATAGRILAQVDGAASVGIIIRGAVEKPIALTASDLSTLPQHRVGARDDAEQAATFSGVTLQSVLERAGVRFGQALRQARLSTFILVEAADGYRVVFALPELDNSFTDKIVLLALAKDGKPLSVAEGPFRIVVPDEKKHDRWVRQVKTIRVLRAEDAFEE